MSQHQALSELQAQLLSMGFDPDAIAAAIVNVRYTYIQHNQDAYSFHPQPAVNNIDSAICAMEGTLQDSTASEAHDGPRAHEAPCKLVLIVRRDLGLSQGKCAAQCAHATLSAYRAAAAKPHILSSWEAQGEPVIVVCCETLSEMQALEDEAKSERNSQWILPELLTAALMCRPRNFSCFRCRRWPHGSRTWNTNSSRSRP